jgi:hypothetical protein
MPDTRSIRALRRAVLDAGMGVNKVRQYLRRIPGAPRNEDWFEVSIWCPCGRAKSIHVSRESVPQFGATLTEHLKKDGL